MAGSGFPLITNPVAVTTNSVALGLITNFNGWKFYSPNDVAVKSDGTIWFTDPVTTAASPSRGPVIRPVIGSFNFIPPTRMPRAAPS